MTNDLEKLGDFEGGKSEAKRTVAQILFKL